MLSPAMPAATTASTIPIRLTANTMKVALPRREASPPAKSPAPHVIADASPAAPLIISAENMNPLSIFQLVWQLEINSIFVDLGIPLEPRHGANSERD